jgi:hypothetical protein
MLDKKLENKHNPSILFLATYWNLSLINGNLEKNKNLRNLANFGHFLHGKSFV